MNKDDELRHQMVALPTVRVRANKAGGSGTVIYSAPNGNGEYSTYILTNHHVVESCIEIKPKWESMLQSERKRDVFAVVDTHFFKYRWDSRAIGGTTIQSNIMTYDVEEDLALLKLRSGDPVPAVATLYPKDKENELRIGWSVIAIGAGLGEPPVQTGGFLSQFGREIEHREYWLNTAPAIYGNSGGALFLGKDVGEHAYKFIGVPARIAVTLLGWTADPIPHLQYAIPITRVYSFLEGQKFRFIYDSEFTEEGEEETRHQLLEEETRKRAMASAV